jgi:hypothetical protein
MIQKSNTGITSGERGQVHDAHIHAWFLIITYLTASYLPNASPAEIAVFSAVFCGLSNGGFSNIFSSTIELVLLKHE